MADEDQKPNPERLREFSEAGRSSLEQQLFSALSPDAVKGIRRRDKESFGALKDAPEGDWMSNYLTTLCSELKAMAIDSSASALET